MDHEAGRSLAKAAELASGFRLAKIGASGAGGYSPHPQALGANRAGGYAKEVQRHLKTYGESVQHVRKLLMRSTKKPVVTPTLATGPQPAGFGGSGYSGSASAQLGAPPTPGNVTLAAPAAPAVA